MKFWCCNKALRLLSLWCILMDFCIPSFVRNNWWKFEHPLLTIFWQQNSLTWKKLFSLLFSGHTFYHIEIIHHCWKRHNEYNDLKVHGFIEEIMSTHGGELAMNQCCTQDLGSEQSKSGTSIIIYMVILWVGGSVYFMIVEFTAIFTWREYGLKYSNWSTGVIVLNCFFKNIWLYI